tara:strand:- start:720 stop:989 length:270 start_codon:yes stop_codon:yes gene_type:complete
MNDEDPQIERIERKSKPRKCPKCGNAPVGTILWGMPCMDSKLQESIDAGKIIIGGCCLSGDDATWECSKCHQQFWKPIPEEKLIRGEYR